MTDTSVPILLDIEFNITAPPTGFKGVIPHRVQFELAAWVEDDLIPKSDVNFDRFQLQRHINKTIEEFVEGMGLDNPESHPDIVLMRTALEQLETLDATI